MMRKFVGLEDPEDRVFGAFVMGKVMLCYALLWERLRYVMLCFGKGLFFLVQQMLVLSFLKLLLFSTLRSTLTGIDKR